MNIQQAREAIKQAKVENADNLNLSSYGGNSKLTSEDLNVLLPELKELINLTELDLSTNQIGDIEVLRQLTRLTELYLRDNQISDIEALGQLTQLTGLDLSGNQISDIKILRKLNQLTRLYLIGNKELENNVSVEILSKYWEPLRIISAYYGIEDGVYQSYKYAPEKIWELIKAKLKKPDENKALLECRVVLIGQGNAGKTSLRQRLLDLPFEDKGKTEGVEIEGKYFKIRDEDVWVNIWDFGGQEVYHTTHKFFFRERCLYILVIDGRAGMEKYIVKYWLHQIKELAKSNAPLIIIVNKAECNDELRIDKRYKYGMKSLFAEFKQIYPNIKAVHYVSTNTPLYINRVKKTVIKSIDKDLSEVFSTYPPYYAQTRELFKVDEEGKSKFGNYISKGEFERQLSEEARKDEKVVEILDILGVFCHFKQDENEMDDELGKIYVLNPEWITKGVYKILSSYILNEKAGKVEFADIRTILNKSEYEEKYRYIIKLMRRFKLCFIKNYQGKDYIIFPTWLPIKEVPYTPFTTNISKFEYQYEGETELEKAITNYIVDVQSYDGGENDSYWRRGIVVRESEIRSLVKADVKNETLIIIVEGNEKERNEKLKKIKHYFSKFHDENEIRVKEINFNEFEKIEEIIATSNLLDKHLLAQIPQLQDEIKNLQNKVEIIRPLKSGYEKLEEILELEKISSELRGIKDERVRFYEGYLIAFICVLFLGYFLWYRQNWDWLKDEFSKSEHFFAWVAPFVPIIGVIIWKYISKENTIWEKIIIEIENRVSNNLENKNKAKLNEYNNAKNELETRKSTIDKAKAELDN